MFTTKVHNLVHHKNSLDILEHPRSKNCPAAAQNSKPKFDWSELFSLFRLGQYFQVTLQYSLAITILIENPDTWKFASLS